MTVQDALFRETHRIAYIARFVYILSGYGSCWPRFRLLRTSGSFVTLSSITIFIAEVRGGKSMRHGLYRRLRRLVRFRLSGTKRLRSSVASSSSDNSRHLTDFSQIWCHLVARLWLGNAPC